jgi:proteic killer suppression protein
LVIYFRSRKIEKQLSAEKEIVRHFGRNARLIIRRIQQLLAAENLDDFSRLPGTGFHLLGGNRNRQMAVYLEHPFRLIFEPSVKEIPLKENNEIELTAIKAITIIDIEDYH